MRADSKIVIGKDYGKAGTTNPELSYIICVSNFVPVVAELEAATSLMGPSGDKLSDLHAKEWRNFSGFSVTFKLMLMHYLGVPSAGLQYH